MGGTVGRQMLVQESILPELLVYSKVPALNVVVSSNRSTKHSTVAVRSIFVFPFCWCSDSFVKGSAYRAASGCRSLQQVADADIQFAKAVKLLGVTLDTSLSFDQYISNVVRACNFFLRSLRHLQPSLIFESTKSMATAIIGTRIPSFQFPKQFFIYT